MDPNLTQLADRFSAVERSLSFLVTISQQNAALIQSLSSQVDNQSSQIQKLQSDLLSFRTLYESNDQKLATECARGFAELQTSWQDCSTRLSTMQAVVRGLVNGREQLQQEVRGLASAAKNAPQNPKQAHLVRSPPAPRHLNGSSRADRLVPFSPPDKTESDAVDPPIRVIVRHPDGRELPLDVRPTDRIEDLMGMIAHGMGVPAEAQRLIHAGQILTDEGTCHDWRIQNGSILLLILRRVRPQGKVPVELPPWTPFPGVRDITVKTLTGRCLTISVKLSDRVEDLKTAIQHLRGMSPDQHRLIYRGQELANEMTLADCGITFGTMLHIVLRHPG
jgi:uncharacterized ubiquitin-like protein YukD